jgi:hypothetical protein
MGAMLVSVAAAKAALQASHSSGMKSTCPAGLEITHPSDLIFRGPPPAALAL